jgi:hypothetical protein
MPLPPPPVDREPLHTRTIEFRGYRRADGLYDIEGRVTDIKDHPMQPPGRASAMPPGVPVHDMSVRVVIDEHLVISDIVAVVDTGPYGDCPSATRSLEPLRGARIGAGWSQRVKALLGRESCTHLVELMIPLATAAYQTLAPAFFNRPDKLDAKGKPVRIDSCYAYASDRGLARVRWPAHYTGGVSTAPVPDKR